MNDATKQLRAGLEERGIEYKAINRLVTDIQRNGLFIRVYDYGDDPDCQMCVKTRCKTTEQAIEVIAATVGPGTCQADETDTWECVCDGIGHYGERMTIHVMECDKCGHTYEHVNGSYEYCPRCGRSIVEVSE